MQMQIKNYVNVEVPINSIIVIIIELTHSKTTLENSLKLKPQLALLDFAKLLLLSLLLLQVSDFFFFHLFIFYTLP